MPRKEKSVRNRNRRAIDIDDILHEHAQGLGDGSDVPSLLCSEVLECETVTYGFICDTACRLGWERYWGAGGQIESENVVSGS